MNFGSIYGSISYLHFNELALKALSKVVKNIWSLFNYLYIWIKNHPFISFIIKYIWTAPIFGTKQYNREFMWRNEWWKRKIEMIKQGCSECSQCKCSLRSSVLTSLNQLVIQCISFFNLSSNNFVKIFSKM